MFAKYFQASGVERRTMLESRGAEVIPVTPEQVFEVSLMGCVDTLRSKDAEILE